MSLGAGARERKHDLIISRSGTKLHVEAEKNERKTLDRIGPRQEKGTRLVFLLEVDSFHRFTVQGRAVRENRKKTAEKCGSPKGLGEENAVGEMKRSS